MRVFGKYSKKKNFNLLLKRISGTHHQNHGKKSRCRDRIFSTNKKLQEKTKNSKPQNFSLHHN